MADNNEGEETGCKGNDWEVVSLTASTYAAAPDPTEVGSSQVSDNDVKAETLDSMFMSGHFVFPPSQHENLPIEPELIKPQNKKVGELYEASPLVTMVGNNSFVKDDDHLSIEQLMFRRFHELQIFDEKNNTLSGGGGVDFGKNILLPNEENTFSTTESRSYHHCSTTVNSSSIKEGESEEYESDSGSQNEVDRYYNDDLPCKAWWKRRALSVYVHAKEANTFWSFFIAAAVMGIVIIGHQWQHERWKLLQLRWQMGISDVTMMGRILSPISRFKHMIIGGQKQGLLTTKEL